jgi:ribosome biogenesis GTPase
VFFYAHGGNTLITEPEILTGVVLNGAHGVYDVHTDSGVLRCTLRGKLKKAFARAQSTKAIQNARPRYDKILAQTSRPERMERRAQTQTQTQTQTPDSNETATLSRLSIGDRVKLRRLDDSNGLIEEILPRHSALSRKDVGSSDKKVIQQTLLANLDQVVLVFAVVHPEPHFGMLDRYLVICESVELQPIICLNKIDLPHSPEIEEAAALYSSIGYTVLWTSTRIEESIDTLRSMLRDHMTLFTGPSGAGKSSLVNAIEPGMAIRTGLVSDVTGKGKHTTSGSQLYPLSGGGWLADSAGIRELAAWNVSEEEVADCFVEFRPFIGECTYSDCLHIDEEGCAIRQAVEDGLINESRYKSYVRVVLQEER